MLASKKENILRRNFVKEPTINGKTVVLGLQHTFVMFGATVLVPILTGLDIAVALFAAGVGTLIFHVVTGFKVPVFLGSSFAFIPGIIAVSAAEGDISYALGGIFIAGFLYIIVAVIFKYVGAHKLHDILPPHVTGPMIIMIGLILAPVAISNANGTNSPDISKNIAWLIALFTFASGVFVKIYFERFGWKFASNLPVLLSGRRLSVRGRARYHRLLQCHGSLLVRFPFLHHSFVLGQGGYHHHPHRNRHDGGTLR